VSEKTIGNGWPFPWRFDRSRYTDLYLASQVTEEQVQKAIIEFLAIFRIDAMPIDAGGRRQRGRMMGAARAAGVDLAGVQNVKTGRQIPAGFADLEATLAPIGRALYIEVKAPAWINEEGKIIRAAGHPSPDQIEFLFSKHRRGAVVLVAWSAPDVEEIVGEYFDANLKALR
jgi:hypothetical protein